MPSEPLEAEFASPPALSKAQEDELRELEREGPLKSEAPSLTETVITHKNDTNGVPDLDRLHTRRSRQGYNIVEFEKGAGEDPREWGKMRKWLVTLSTAFLCLAVALGSSIVTGDMEGPAADLHASQEVVNLSVACFVIGFGLGPLFFAPLSEVIGRRPVYIISIFFYFIFTLPSALAKNAATLVISRQIAGIASSAPMCNVGGSVADIWSIEERGIPMAIFSVTIFIGPCIGPLVGGFIGQTIGWRWIYWVLFIFLGCCVFLTLIMPETLAPVLLHRKAVRLRKETGDESYRTLAELERRPFKVVIKEALLRPLIMLATEPVVFFMSFYLSFIYSILYLLFFAFPIAFSEVRGFSAGMTGVTFISVVLGIGLAMGIAVPAQERIFRAATKNGTYPEARLYTMMVGSIFLPVALFIFAFTGGYEWVHWIGPCIGGGVFGWSMILIYISANSYIVDSYSSYAASAIASKTLMRSEVGAMVPLYVNQMFHNMGFQYAGLLLALVSVAIMPIPFVFFIYGERIRQKSNMATKTVRMKEQDAEVIEKEKM
ncbi:major facilitator superfamily domain-containing protein [Schizophyllum amplum]|uniref:Major facilitator superfamily domain-containing protein n=1 Tax=Schizophyllum amplum TaxID=97359 RepID=A0A550CG21_9AGAR|nr:major facilitator superfamily domain-containing protein [Auriculariopsis ampla]